MTVKEQIELYEECERAGTFDKDVMPYSVDDMLRIDGEYEYLCTRFYERVGHFFLFLLATLIWRPVLYFSLGFHIRGAKNRRGIKGAISVSNHVHPLDCVMIHGLSLFPWKIYHTGAPFNMKKGIRGALIKGFNYLPLSTSFEAQKNFRYTVEDRLKKGDIVHFYPDRRFGFVTRKSDRLSRALSSMRRNSPCPFCPLSSLSRKRPCVSSFIAKNASCSISCPRFIPIPLRRIEKMPSRCKQSAKRA